MSHELLNTFVTCIVFGSLPLVFVIALLFATTSLSPTSGAVTKKKSDVKLCVHFKYRSDGQEAKRSNYSCTHFK